MKITFRLRPGRDDELKDWYQSLPRGDKSRVIRNILKEYLGSKQEDIVDYQHQPRKNNKKKAADVEFKNVDFDVEFKEKEIEVTDGDIDEKLDNLLENF